MAKSNFDISNFRKEVRKYIIKNSQNFGKSIEKVLEALDNMSDEELAAEAEYSFQKLYPKFAESVKIDQNKLN